MMTFLSVLEVIALFLIAGAGWRCAHWLLKITYQVGFAGRDYASELTQLRMEIEDNRGKAQKKRSK